MACVIPSNSKRHQLLSVFTLYDVPKQCFKSRYMLVELSTVCRCDPARCKAMPTPPRNGMIVAPKTFHGAKGKISVHC